MPVDVCGLRVENFPRNSQVVPLAVHKLVFVGCELVQGAAA